MDLPSILLAICGFTLSAMWGMNLWEIRQLRKDNRELSQAIAQLSNTIVALQTELAHCVRKDECAVMMGRRSTDKGCRP